MEFIELFGKQVKLKTHNCHLFGEEATKVEKPYVNLYVRTKFCNAKCKFCTYADDASKFNRERYVEVLKEITSKIEIRKLAVSGGEPTLYWDNFEYITYTGREYIGQEAELSMNTDGLRWEKLWTDPIIKEYHYVQLSRHHYDDKINDEIFGTKTPTSEEIKWATSLQSHPHKFQFRCNLINGFIDSKEEVFKYLDWSNDLNVNDVGLVSLMPVNDYSKENFIFFHIAQLVGDNFFLTKEWERHGGGCQCFNYIYTPENNFRRPMKVYHKNTFKPSDVNETLVFDGYNLRIGFDGPIIY
jgi:organic radical activating enzyme